MTSTTTKPDSLQSAADMAGALFDNWFDPLVAEVRARSREFIEEVRTFQERKSDEVTAKFGPARAVDSLNENLGNRGAPRQQNAWAESVAPFSLTESERRGHWRQGIK